MRIDSAAPSHTAPTPKNHESHVPRANAKAHGVVRKLGTDHFSPTAEARLTANFGHLLPTEPEPQTDLDAPVSDPVDETTDPTTDSAGDETSTPTEPTEPTIDLLA